MKLAGNYAPVLGPTERAKASGYAINLFLDAVEHRYIEEFATSNFAALTKPDANGHITYVTPLSSSVLESITNRSLSELAAKHFKWDVRRERVEWADVIRGRFAEVAAVGTAVVISKLVQ